MVVAVKHYRIAYMPLPKAACSSVKSALAGIDPDVRLPPREEYSNGLWHKIYPTRRFRPHRWQQYSDYWRFCVVRDPVKRLISCYTDRVVRRQGLRNSPKIRKGLTNLPVDPDPDFFFQNLREYMQVSSVVKHHALPARLFLGKTLDHYERVYKIETLSELSLDLERQTGHEIFLNRENASGMDLKIDDLNGKTVEILRPYLAEEYELLNGYYENPLA